MSNDYISRVDIETWLRTERASLDTDADVEYVIERLRKEILPADVRPVVRGEWIETGYFDQYYQPIYECSHCHGEVADSFMAKHLFCLHCGADMKDTR